MSYRQTDIKKVAYYQRFLLWAVLLATICNPNVTMSFLPSLAPNFMQGMVMIMGLLFLVTYITIAVLGVMLMIGLGDHPAIIAITSLVLLAPCINIFILLILNRHATARLRKYNIRVGFMGANPEDVKRATDPNLCKHCGYDLRGNVSGFCTECGHPLPVAKPA